MDLYTTSFSYPRPTPRSSSSPHAASSLNLPGSGSISSIPLPNVTTSTATQRKSTSSAPSSNAAQAERDWEVVQKLVLDVTSREGCLVTVTRESIDSPAHGASSDEGASGGETTVWNFHLSGGYQSVMAARGAVLRELPRDNRTVLKVARTDMLESPLAPTSALKADVQRRLDDIAADSKAFIAVVNPDNAGANAANVVAGAVLGTADGRGSEHLRQPDVSSPAQVNGDPTPATTEDGSTAGVDDNTVSTAETTESSQVKTPEPQLTGDGSGSRPGAAPTSTQVTYGLETERLCDLVITGGIESVEIAKVRLLVMLDELSGLHAEVCDIDYKLQNIIASRKRSVIQSIQEETATNIYFPTPLVGIFNPPQPGANPSGYRSLGMGPVSVQPTGNMGMQQMHGNGMGMGGQGGSMGMGGMNGAGNGGYGPVQGYGQTHGHGHHQQHRNQAPVYNPHQHVHYPYQPQPLDINPQTTRGMPYTGPGVHHYAPGPSPMNGMAPSPHHGPMSVNHTGMTQMSSAATGFQTRGMSSPMPMSPSPMLHGQHGHAQNFGMHQHQQHHGPMPHHMHGNHAQMGHHGPHGHGHAHAHGHMAGPGMGMGMIMPYQGQTQMHVGLGAGPMGAQNGTGMSGGNHGHGHAPGQMGPGMGGVGQYGSGPHPGLSVHSGEQGALGKSSSVWITGEFFGVQRARDMLLNVAMQKSKLVISRDTAILPRKLDWLLTERIEEFKTIMSDNGTYVQVPAVGSQASLITVFGDHRVNIERTIRSIMALACQFYVASFWLLPISFDVLMPSANLNPAQMQPILKNIAHATGAEVVFKSNCFEMHGLEQEVRAAVMMVLELEVIQNFHHEIRFQIELANEHREFISGKKNGKINKIMKLAGVKIKFETFNDYNFLMDISGSDMGALQGLSMLQEELPAEVSFHVPESYHKRIIGVGGKNIQRIMKLYGVYVKFSNAEEFAALGGYLDNEDNVVARTPAKNAINLESLKQSVMEMVNPKDKDYTVESVSIPRRYHRTLLGEKSIFIHDIEGKTNSMVRFPYKESASDIVTIFGPESQVHIAAAMLLEHVPFEADLHVPPNPELTRLVTSTEFIVFAEKVKRDHQIAIVPSAKFGQGDEAIFKFRCQRSNIDFLGTARDSLEEFLSQHGVQVYPSHAHKRVDTYTDAFTHFNSKLLATSAAAAAAAAEGEPDTVVPRQRPATITADVKALFNGGAHAHSAVNSSFRSVDDSLGFAGPLSYHDPRRGGEFWPNPPVQQPRADAGDVSKRDSDPNLQDRVRSSAHGTSHGLRTQSLDIKSLQFSRGLAAAAFGPVPSPPGSGSPHTATAQYFPGHQHQHQLRPNVTGRGPHGYEMSHDAVDSVAQANVSVNTHQ